MIIQARIIPRSSRNAVVKENGSFRVYTTVAPTDGKANQAVIKILADFFKIPKSAVVILRGHTARDKVIEINL